MDGFVNTYLAGQCNRKILLYFTFLVRTCSYDRLLTEGSTQFAVPGKSLSWALGLETKQLMNLGG